MQGSQSNSTRRKFRTSAFDSEVTNLGAVAKNHQSTDYEDQHKLKHRETGRIILTLTVSCYIVY